MIQVTSHAQGCILAVRGQPGAKRDAVVGEQNGSLKVAVRAPADQGRANRAIVELLADTFGLRKSQVELIAGESARQKKVLFRGVTVEEMQRLLRDLSGSE